MTRAKGETMATREDEERNERHYRRSLEMVSQKDEEAERIYADLQRIAREIERLRIEAANLSNRLSRAISARNRWQSQAQEAKG